MRIGIVPGLTPALGGVYQYSLTMLQALDVWGADGCTDEFVAFAWDVGHPALAQMRRPLWTVKPLQPPSLPRQGLDVIRRIVGEGPHREAWRWLRPRLTPLRRKDLVPRSMESRRDLNHWFRQCGVELMLYPVPGSLPFEAGVPYVMAIHDLQHRLQPDFPEVSANGEWQRREYYFRNGSRCATLLLADSEAGREDILRFYGPYGVTADRVKILPFLPASYLAVDVPESERQRVRATHHLPDRYLFYPAQFWSHKNHARIVEALALLKRERSLQISIVFCGSHSGELRERVFRDVVSLASRSGLEEHVRYLGYVPESDISGIYAEATALIMPTLFGPTNIPVVEAWALGCPVLTSDIRGVREHAQDAAVLVDPRCVEAIADGIYRIWTDDNLRTAMVERGRQRLKAYTADDYRRRLVAILEEAKMRVGTEAPRIRPY